MSTTVDQRVVQMRFDNQQFESGVQTSINTLGKLKQSLNFTSASKGLEKLQKTGSSFDLSGISNSLTTISDKFNALGVVGFTVFQRLTNAAINTGSRMIKALTITPILSGFQEYETQINATQTILSNTSKEGATIKDVNAALDELNKYADLTIYNFTEMTKNIGTFTAAGVKLKTSVNAIQGIANLAAASGSTSQQASTAMYQLSQALASGTVKLMDWNSVVNAGMGGAKFQDALKMTARVHNIAIDDMIKKEGSFRETLKNGWLTSDILTETLQHFTEFNEEYNEETLKAQGYTEAQIEEIRKLGIDATEAATKVKTFTQLWSVLQEAAQSGWAQSWRLIVGDFEQAKTTLTEFSDVLTEVINASSAKRNAFLTEGLTSGFNQFITEAGVDFEDFSIQVQETAKKHGVAIEKMIDEDGTFEETLHRGWMTADILKDSLNETTKSMSKMSEKELKAAGYTDAQVEALKEFNKEIQNGTVNVEEWAEKMGTMSGRENLMESLLNIFRAIMALAKPIKEAFDEIFPAMTGEQLYDITENIRNFTEKLIISEETAGKVKSAFLGLFSAIRPFVDVLKALASISVTVVKTLLPMGGGLLTVVGELGNFAYEAINSFGASEKLSKAVGQLNEGFTAAGDKLKWLGEKVGPALTKVFDTLKNAAGKLVSSLSEIFNSGGFFQLFSVLNAGLITSLIFSIRKGLDGLVGSDGVITTFSEMFTALGEVLTTWQSKLKAETIKTIAISIAILAGSLVALALVDPSRLAAAILGMGVLFKALTVSMKEMSGILSIKQFKNIGKAASLMLAMAASIAILATAARLIANLSWSELAKGLLGTVVLMKALTMSAESLTSKKQQKFMKSAAGLIAFAAAIRILASAVAAMSGLDLPSLAKGIGGVIVMMVALVGAAKLLNKNGAGMSVSALGFIAMAAALKILASVVTALSKLDIIALGKGLGATVVALYAMVDAAKILSKNGASVVLASVGLIGFAAALKIIAGVMVTLGGFTWTEIAKGLAAMGGAIAIIAAAMLIVPAGKMLLSAAALLVAGTAYMSLATAMKVTGSMSWESIGKGLATLAGAFVVLGVAGLVLAPITPIILALSAALALVGVGVLSLGVGITALAAGFIALGAGIGTFAAGVASSAVAIVEALKTIILGILELIPDVVEAIGKAIVAFAKVIIKSASTIAEAIVTVIDETLKAIANHIDSICDSLAKILSVIFDRLFTKIKEYAPKVWKKAKEIGGEFIEGIGEGLANIAEAGKNAVEGFIQGVKDNISGIVGSGINLGKSFLNSLKDKLGIASPSKEAKKIAQFAIEGFAIGIDQNLGDVRESAGNLADAVSSALKIELATLFDQMTYGRKATALFMREFGDLSTVDSAKKSFEQASKAVQNYAKQLYLNSDAYKENKQAVKDLEDEQKSLEKQIAKLSKKTDDESKSSLETAKDNLKETKKELKKARREITEGTKAFIKNQKAAYEDLQSSIASSLESSMDPLSMSLDTQIDMFAAFEEATDAVSATSLLNNMKSQVEGISKWNDRLEVLANKGFAAALLDDLKELGPTATNYIKAFEDMTADEVTKANAYFQQSAQLTVDTFLNNWQDSKDAVTKWSENLVELSQKGVEQGFLEAIAQAGMSTEELVNALMNMTGEQLDQLNSLYKDSLVDEHAAQAIMMALSAAGAGMSTELANALTSQIDQTSEAGTAITQTATATGVAAGTATATGIATAATSNANTTKVTKAAEELGAATVNGVKSEINVTAGKKMGSNLCKGLVKGLKEGKASVVEAAKEVAQDAVDSANDTLGIESPSKVFMKIGRFVDLGFAKGLKKYSGIVEDEASEVGNSSLKGVKNALSNIAKFVDSDMDTTPVIRPVIDLDNLRSDIDSMNGMLSNQVVDVDSIRAKTASISSGFGGSSASVDNSTKLQNGNTFSFVQNNYSPKALSQIEIYRQTKNQFSAMKGALQGV